nr:hypothetical protein [uncultured Flavobacterium sp.]
MENELIELCLEEIFTDENITTIWECRNSDEDIIALNTYLPIRYKKNNLKGRNIEIARGSEIGNFYSTIILVENDNFFFPSSVYKLANRFFGEYHKLYSVSQTFRREYQILMGAFSVQSFYHAFSSIYNEPYHSYEIEFKITKSYDGFFETFINKSYFDYSNQDEFILTSLEEVPLSKFKKDYNLISPFHYTHYTSRWVNILIQKRLLELYTKENYNSF